MNTDFRLAIDFWQHPKTKKLVRRAGLEGVRSLQILWAWTACNRPNGSLTGMDDEDIELAADWSGDAGTLVNAMVELRWLEKTENGYALHEWQEHNPWAADAEARGDKARLSRLRQVNPAAYEQCVAEGKTAISQREYEELKSISGDRQRTAGETPANASPAPAPSPSPKPIKNTPPFNPPTGGPSARASEPPREKYPADFEAFWEMYPNKAGKLDAAKAWKKQKPYIPPMDKLRQVISAQRSSDQWQRGIIPHASTWLNGHRWQDELEAVPAEPVYKDPPPPELSLPDEHPDRSPEDLARIAAIRERLARSKAVA